MPSHCFEEEIHAFGIGQHGDRADPVDDDASLLAALAHGRIDNGFAPLPVAAGQCEAAVHQAGVGATKQQQPRLVVPNEGVDDDGEDVSRSA